MALGAGPDGDGWLVAVEDPLGSGEPSAVLCVQDRAVATSSTRVRSWTVDGSVVHHLIDPRTSRPAAADLASVTVVGEDPALSEVWSKALFVTGRTGIRAASESRGLAVLWIDRAGRVGTSRTMRPHLEWLAPRAA
jgi:thiamine biosynthesis lipoprotein